MSRALALAREMHSSGRSLTDAEKNSLTPQEMTLLTNASMCLKNPQSEVVQDWKSLTDTAERLDKGGVLEPPFMLRVRHRAACDNARRMYMQATSDMHQWTMPGMDIIAAGHECRKSVSDLTECSIAELMKNY